MLTKLPANADNFNYGPYVRGPHMQLACVTCSFPAKTGKFLQVPHAEFTQVNLPQIKGISPKYKVREARNVSRL